MRRAALASAAALALAGCGGGGDAGSVLDETASNLGKIRSGTLHLSLVVQPRGGGAENPFGFVLDGPFSLGQPGELPLLRVAYTQIANGQRATVTIISTARNAYIETGGRTYELRPDQEDDLRSAAARTRAAGGFGEFAIDSWIEDPELEDGGEVGGADTDRVTADLNVVNATNDLLALARALGQSVPALEGQSADQLARSVRSSRFALHTGKDDRFLRRLEIGANLGLDVPRVLRNALGRIVGAEVTLELGVDGPNKPVTVQDPENALPSAELPAG